jgi:hypothetical protein
MVKLTATTIKRMEGKAELDSCSDPSNASTDVSRSQMRRGVLHVDLTERPQPSRAGYQPPLSGLHFSHQLPFVPILLQFPLEILVYILGYLEPLWLFQVSAAFSDLHELLGFEHSNKLWYDAVPPALFLEPEHFQNEMLVEDRMAAYSARNEVDGTLQFA